MSLKKIVLAVVVLMGSEALAHGRVDAVLSLNEVQPKKVEKTSKPHKRIIETLNTGEPQKTELPKNARHDATGGVFI